MSGTVPDCHMERLAALAAALGPERLGALVARFRADLAALAEAAEGLDGRALQHWAHRLHGSGSTLGFDAAAAALAALAGLAATHPEGAPLPAVRSALADAGAALARGERLMAASVPGFVAGGTTAQDADASKR